MTHQLTFEAEQLLQLLGAHYPDELTPVSIDELVPNLDLEVGGLAALGLAYLTGGNPIDGYDRVGLTPAGVEEHDRRFGTPLAMASERLRQSWRRAWNAALAGGKR